MFTMSLQTENAAFDDTPASEIARILRNVAARIEAGEFEGRCLDANGNYAGEYGIRERRERPKA